jgi:hypothetical protein
MKTALVLLTAAVLLSLALNADAEGLSRYDQIFHLHQQGLITIPAKMTETGEYLCYSRANPNTPIFLVVEARPNQVRRMRASSESLQRLVAGVKVPLAPVQLPIFNGTLLGGHSRSENLLESLLNDRLRPTVFFGMSYHPVTGRQLAAILKVAPDQDLETACANTETLEYVCIENVSEI